MKIRTICRLIIIVKKIRGQLYLPVAFFSFVCMFLPILTLRLSVVDNSLFVLHGNIDILLYVPSEATKMIKLKNLKEVKIASNVWVSNSNKKV